MCCARTWNIKLCITGADPGGAPGAPSKKLEKYDFLRKIVIFHRNTPNISSAPPNLKSWIRPCISHYTEKRNICIIVSWHLSLFFCIPLFEVVFFFFHFFLCIIFNSVTCTLCVFNKTYDWWNEGEKNYTIGTVPKSNRKVVGRSKIATPSTHIHERSLLLAWYRHFNKKWRG